MRNYKKITDIKSIKSIKYFRSSDLERTKQEYESDIPFEILYIETDSYNNYYLIKTPKNPFFVRFYLDGGSFCANKIHMRLINPYEKPLRYGEKDNSTIRNVYINGEDAMYDDFFYYEFLKLIESKTFDAFYLDYPNTHFAEYLFELSESQREELKSLINTNHNYSLVITSKKYDYGYENMKAYFLNEDGGGYMNLYIKSITRFMDGGTTHIRLTSLLDNGTIDFTLLVPTKWDKSKLPTLNSINVIQIEDEERKKAAIEYLGLKSEPEYLS